MAKMTMVQALNLALKQEMEKDDRVIVLGEDVGLDGGVFTLQTGFFSNSATSVRSTHRWLNRPSWECPSEWQPMGCARFAKSSFRDSATRRFTRSKIMPPA